MSKKTELVLTQSKETKGTVRYSTDADAAATDSVYIRKHWLDGERPKSIKVTIETQDS